MELISGVAGVDPIVVNVDRIRQDVDRSLIILQANPTRYFRGFPWLVHFHLTRFFMVTEWTCKLRVEGLDGFPLLRRLSFTFSAAHLRWSATLRENKLPVAGQITMQCVLKDLIHNLIKSVRTPTKRLFTSKRDLSC